MCVLLGPARLTDIGQLLCPDPLHRGSGQTFALPTKKKVSEQMEVASVPTYASVLKKGLKLAPVTVHSF